MDSSILFYTFGYDVKLYPYFLPHIVLVLTVVYMHIYKYVYISMHIYKFLHYI